jgi:hypothetical protein
MLEGGVGAEVAEHLLEALSPRVLIALLNLHWQKQLAARRLRKGGSRRDTYICVYAYACVYTHMYIYMWLAARRSVRRDACRCNACAFASHVYIFYMTTSPA